MKPKFEHVIMTRFNLATPGNESALRNEVGWLEERFELFETVCLPSVAQQTNQNFTWIIYFDTDTPVQFRKRIAQLQEKFAFNAYFTELFPASGWSTSLIELVAPKTDYVLTTRLDNDDALTVDFVDRLHTAVAQNDSVIGAYNFTSGFVVANDRLYCLSHPRNAFFSWLDRNGETIKTAPSIQHMQLHKHGHIHQISGEGTWIQMVHTRNVSNKIRGWRANPQTVGGNFPKEIRDSLSEISYLSCLFENIAKRWPANLIDFVKLKI